MLNSVKHIVKRTNVLMLNSVKRLLTSVKHSVKLSVEHTVKRTLVLMLNSVKHIVKQ